MAKQKVELEITGDAKSAESAISGLSTKSVALGAIIASVVMKAFEKLGDAVKYATDQLIEATKASAEQEKAQLLLVNAMKQGGTFTRQAYKDNIELASSLQALTVYGDENILMVQKELATYGVEGKQLKELTALTLDFASAKGMDLQSAGQLIAKTIGSESNALARYGIQVEGAAGSTARMQSATEQLSALFGGTAQTEAKSFSGNISNIKNAWDDLYETGGDTITQQEFMTVVFDTARKAIADLNAWVIKHKQDIMIFVKTALLSAIDGFILLVGTIKWVIQILGMAGSGFMILGSVVLKIVSLIIEGWELVFKTITNVASKIPVIGEKFKKIGDDITGVFTDAKKSVNDASASMDNTATSIAGGTVAIVENLTALQDGATGFRTAIESAGVGAIGVLEKIDVTATEKAAKLIKQQKDMTEAMQGLWKVASAQIIKISDAMANDLITGQKSMGYSLEQNYKKALGQMIMDEIDKATTSISITAATEIGKASLGGFLSFGVTLLAIPLIAAAAGVAKAGIRALAGFAQGGIVSDKGSRIPLPSSQVVEAHAGEVFGTPTRLAASGVGGLTVNFNNYGPIASDIDIRNIGALIADEIKNGLRGAI